MSREELQSESMWIMLERAYRIRNKDYDVMVEELKEMPVAPKTNLGK